MRILHTADLHLGRHFEGHSLEQDHAVILEQVFDAVAAHAVDVLIIAGDVFDRASPPESAVRQFNAFIQKVMKETGAAIALIAGNHDSGDRIGSMALLADGNRALVRGSLAIDNPPLVLQDKYGPVAISGLPFAYEFAARECFQKADIKAPADVLRAQVEAARAAVPGNARWVVIAHAFVSGADPSASERPLSRTAGGIETVPSDVFDGAHYVALGHLHRPQVVGASHIRYAGSPLAFGFDEEGCAKSMTLVDLARDGSHTAVLLPLEPMRSVRTLRGSLAELLATPPSAADLDFVRVVLTDPDRLIEPMKRIRARYPNACSLVYERDNVAHSGPRLGMPARAPLDDPPAVVDQFLAYVRGMAPSDAEARLVATEIAGLEGVQEAAA